MARRDKHKLHVAVIAFLAIGVFGSSAWLVLYDVTSGRPQIATDAGAASALPGPAPRDLERDILRSRRAIQADGFLGGVLARFHLRAGRYPLRLTDLLERPADLDAGIRWDGPYVTNAEVLDDPWDRRYEYVFPGSNNPEGYDLWSTGPDGISGTADDINNW